MPALEQASLSPAERRTLERFVGLLQERFGLRPPLGLAVRVAGARRAAAARVGRRTDRRHARRRDDLGTVLELMDEAADAEGVKSPFFSVHVYTPEHVAQRREIRSFFIQEVDRDNIVLAGEP